MATELHVAPRTLGRMLEGLEPDSTEGRYNRWFLHRAIQHIYGGGAGAPLDLSAERARLASEQADKEAMRNAELRRDLIRVEDVRDLWRGVFSEVRAHMLALPTMTAPLVLGLETAPEVQEVLDRHVRDALAGCARAGDGVPVGARAPAPADGERVGGSTSNAKPRGERRTRTVAH